LRREFGEDSQGSEIDSSPGTRTAIRGAPHSVVTMGLIDESGHSTPQAVERVLPLFAGRLHP